MSDGKKALGDGEEAPQTLAAPEVDVDDEQLLSRSKTKLWPILVGLGVAVAGVGGYVAYQATRPDPMKVLVAIDADGFWWQGSTPSALVSDKLAERLKKLGFEAIDGGDPAVVEKLANVTTAEEARQKLRAGFVITGDLTPKVEKLPVDDGLMEARVDGEIRLSFAGEAPKDIGNVRTWSGARKEDKALELLGESLGDQVFDRAIRGLLGHEQIQRLVHGDDAIARGNLTSAKAYVELRDKQLEHAKQQLEQLATERKKSEAGGHDQKYHTVFEGEDLLAGVSPEGMLIKRSATRYFFNPEQNMLGYFRDLHSLMWKGFDGKEREIAQGYNFYSYPGVAPSGSPVVLIEDLFGDAKTITIIDKQGAPRRLRVDGSHRYQAPKLSPNGTKLAVFDLSCMRCPAGLLVLDVKSGEELYAVKGDAGNMGSFAFIDDDHLAYVYREKAPPDPEAAPADDEEEGQAEEPAAPPVRLLQVALAGGAKNRTPDTLYEAPRGEAFDAVSAGQGGKWLALGRSAEDGKQLAVFDVQSRAMTAYDVQGGTYMVTASPAGRAVAFERYGEIFHYSIDNGVLTRLTDNQARDRYPMFSQDGARVFYESLAEDPSFPKQRVLTAIVSVQSP